VIIFAPLTLTHVLSAIYVSRPAGTCCRPHWPGPPQLEYFGRPLGLWRTSHKLAHTLFEVGLICAWAAALSLCFDNFFTSPLPCASLRAIAWYNELPRPTLDPSRVPPEAVRHHLCNDQVFLIVLVGIGLLMYCMNLVIRRVPCNPRAAMCWSGRAQLVPHLREGQAPPARVERVAGAGRRRRRWRV
jgi:hypothetical protein